MQNTYWVESTQVAREAGADSPNEEDALILK